MSAICPPGTLVNYTYRSYVTNFIVQETIDNYKYMQLNDYLLGAMSLVDSVMDIQFPPQNYIRMGTDPKRFAKPSVRGDGFSFDISFKGYSSLY